MNPQKIKRSVEHLIERKVPIFLWGPPGIGKSFNNCSNCKRKRG